MHDALNMLLEGWCGERLGEEVGQIVIGVDMLGDDNRNWVASVHH